MGGRKRINLALQGGGAHGAFTWGVCDRLLESEAVCINAITAASAGAMNATVMAYGIHLGDDAGGRDKLAEFWEAIGSARRPFALPFAAPVPFVDEVTKSLGHKAMSAVTSAFSPYQLNPMNWNPLRETVARVVDFDDLKSCTKIEFFISATNVRTGHVRVFRRNEVTIDAVMASACLPHLFHAVEIDGEHYWDGGYMGNPSLWPLFYETDVRDLLVVHINPMVRDEVPMSVPDIENRVNEITFNAALLKEMRAIRFVQKLLREEWLKDAFKDRLADIHYHAIRADTWLKDYPLSSKFDTDIVFLRELRDVGREAADGWLTEHWDKVGRADSTDLTEEFLDGSAGGGAGPIRTA